LFLFGTPINARIALSRHDPAKCPITIPAEATKLNRHRPAIQLNRELLIGSTIVLRNNKKAVNIVEFIFQRETSTA
jgi:hypothetical protein